MEVISPTDCQPSQVLEHDGWTLTWPCGERVIGIDSRDFWKAKRDHQCPQ